jgi:hypothetical protein
MLEDEAARARNRQRLRETTDPAERRVYLTEGLERVERQIGLLEPKAARLDAMIEEAHARRGRIQAGLAELDAAAEPAS